MQTLTPEEIAELYRLTAKRYAAFVERQWLAGDLSYKLLPPQKVIRTQFRSLSGDVRERVMECARGFGKSMLGVAMALEDCIRPCTHPHFPVRILAPGLKQCVDIVTPLLDILSQDAPAGFLRRMKSENKWKVGNTDFILGGFERGYIDTIRGQRARSMYLEECRDVGSEQFEYGIKDVLKPMSLHSNGPLNMMTTTPRELDHYFLKEIVPSAKLNGAYFRFTIDDNPTLTTAQKLLAIKESGGEDSATYKREYLCLAVRDEKGVAVPKFNKLRHVLDAETFAPPEHRYYWISGDTGGVRDKSVLHLSYYDWKRGKMVVEDERVFENQTPSSEMVAGARELEAIAGWTEESQHRRNIDMPGLSYVDWNKDYNYLCQPPFNVKDPFGVGLNQLDCAFLDDRIEIHPRCKFTIASLEHGRLNRNRTDFERTPTLGHCDAISALNYAWHMRRDTENPYPPPPVNADLPWRSKSHGRDPGMEDVASLFSGR